MDTADLYIRVSTDEQADKGFSQRFQEEMLRKYCDLHSIQIQITTIEDHSAKTFARPGWNKLIESYKKKPRCRPKYLLFTKWDRFSRNTGDAYYMIKFLSKWGIEVRAIEQPLDLSIPENKLMMAFFLAAPEVENERRALNIKQGMDRAKREGRWMGSAPIGYRNTISEYGEKFIQPIEPSASIMRNAFESIAEGNTVISKVYRGAVESGLMRSLNCFRRAIKNPVYCGKILLNRANSNDPEYSTGSHQAIISESLFFRVQKALYRAPKIMVRNTANENLPLRGFLFCTKCGKLLTGSGSLGRWHKKYYYYHCQPKCGMRIRADTMHEHFFQFLKQLVTTDYYLSLSDFISRQLFNKAIHVIKSNQNGYFNKIEKLAIRIEKAKQLLLEGSIDGKDYKSIKDAAEVQINILGESLSKSVANLRHLKQSCIEESQNALQLSIFYKSSDINNKRELLRLLFPYGIRGLEFNDANASSPLKFIYGSLSNELSFNASKSIQTVVPKDEEEYILKITSKIHSDHFGMISMEAAKEVVLFIRKVCELSISSIIEKTSFTSRCWFENCYH